MNVTVILTAALMSACVVSARLMGHDWSHNSSHMWNNNVANGRREVARRVQFVPFGLLQTLTGHTRGINSVAFSNDGTRIVSGTYNEIKIWDAQNGGAALQTLSGHTSYVWSVGFNNDGTRIVSGSWDGTIKIWAITPPTVIPTLAPVIPPTVAPIFSTTPRPSSLPSAPLLKPAVPISSSQTLSTSNIVIIVCVSTIFLVICVFFGRRCIKPSVVKTPKDQGDIFTDNAGTGNDTNAVHESALHT